MSASDLVLTPNRVQQMCVGAGAEEEALHE